MSTRGGRRRPSQWELDQAERLVLAAARQAAAASITYHSIRTLGGVARWAVMEPGAGKKPPPWALRLRAWEGGFYGGGASRQAGIDCLRTSGLCLHLAYANLEGLRALAADNAQEREQASARHQDQLRKTRRSHKKAGSGPTGWREVRTRDWLRPGPLEAGPHPDPELTVQALGRVARFQQLERTDRPARLQPAHDVHQLLERHGVGSGHVDRPTHLGGAERSTDCAHDIVDVHRLDTLDPAG